MYHVKPHPSRPYDHTCHRWLRPVWINREWWFDNWHAFIAGACFVGCGDITRPFNHHPYWRRA